MAAGEQQSEAGHDALYSVGSTAGNYQGESYRDAKQGEFIQYILTNSRGETKGLSLLCRFTTADKGRQATLSIDGQKLTELTIPETMPNTDRHGFYNIEYAIPAELLTDSQGKAKQRICVRLTASEETLAPGLYDIRIVRK